MSQAQSQSVAAPSPRTSSTTIGTGKRQPQADSARPAFRRAWDDTALRTKSVMLVAVGVVGGALVGITEMMLGQQIWPMCLGLTLLMMGLGLLARYWVALPFEKLLAQTRQLNQPQRVHDHRIASELLITRNDEVGQLARLIRSIAAEAARSQLQSVHLRRTIDQRVTQATKQATHKLQRLAMRDPLTDLGNRRFLDENLESLFETVKASACDLTCVLMDMDNFKLVNDTHGHGVGDELLIFLGGLIRATVRKEDYAIRLGGDEFIVLMPHCPPARAAAFANRLRTLLRQHIQIASHVRVPADLSVGIASLNRDSPTSGADLIAKADQYAYAAKKAGKGCTRGG